MKLRRKAEPSGRQRLLRDGAGAPPAYIYRSQRSPIDLNTGRQTERPPLKKRLPWRKSFWLQRFGLVTLSLVVLVCLVNILGLSSNAKLVPLSADSQLYLHSASVYQQAVNKLLASSIWNSNKITVNTGRVSQQLRTEFPELSSVSITLPLLAHRPIVYIAPAQPALILSTANGSFIIDTDGRALLGSNAGTASSKADLPLITDQSGLRLKLGDLALSADNVTFIQTIVAELAAKHIANNLVLSAGGGELDAHITGQPYYVKFNLHNNDARQQAGTYLAAMTYLQARNITPSQYIDVRVDGRAYYK